MADHLVKVRPSHFRLKNGDNLKGVPNFGLYKTEDYDFTIETPHLLSGYPQRGKEVRLISRNEIEVGDLLQTEFSDLGTVISIVEKREARGEWVGSPMYYHVTI